MTKLKIYILAATALTLVGCENEETEPDVIRDFPTFSASIAGVRSRATDDYWEDGDKIGISGSGSVNVCYVCHVTITGDGDTLTLKNPEQQIYFRNGNSVTFTAYYPWVDLDGQTTITANTADQSDQKSFDFLWAEAEGSRNSPSVDFKFAHKMSKVTFVFKNGDGMDVSTITKYRLSGLAMGGSFDVTTGTANRGSDTSMVTIDLESSNIKVRDGEAMPSLILFPQEAKSAMLEIFDSNGQYYVCNLPKNTLEAGNNYTYTITVNKTGLKVTGATIKDWTDEEGESKASSADE